VFGMLALAATAVAQAQGRRRWRSAETPASYGCGATPPQPARPVQFGCADRCWAAKAELVFSGFSLDWGSRAGRCKRPIRL